MARAPEPAGVRVPAEKALRKEPGKVKGKVEERARAAVAVIKAGSVDEFKDEVI